MSEHKHYTVEEANTKITEYQAALNTAEKLKIRYEEQLKTVEKDIETVTAKMLELGVNPDTIEVSIEQIQNEIDIAFAELEKNIPNSVLEELKNANI